jgi:hypothetical protein
MLLHRDHVAGAFFILAGAIVFLLSGDLPVGSMAMPGAGMMPKLVLALMIVLGLALMAQARKSPRLATIAWDDLPHALGVLVAAMAATALYNILGFRIAMALMLTGLVIIVERRNPVRGILFGLGVPICVDVLFGTLLKSPLPRGLLGF